MRGAEDLTDVRREIVNLLRQQMEALDSPLGLTDARLTECYERQTLVQELREKLQAATGLAVQMGAVSCEASTEETLPCGTPATAAYPGATATA